MVKYRGWITGIEGDRYLLKTLGVTVCRSEQRASGRVEFEVNQVTEEMLEELNRYWGRLIWGLEPYE